jgi:hypothetical protein
LWQSYYFPASAGTGFVVIAGGAGDFAGVVFFGRFVHRSK